MEGVLRVVEIKDELVISLPMNSGCLHKMIERDVYSDFCDIYVFNYDCSIDDIILQEDETCDVILAFSKNIEIN